MNKVTRTARVNNPKGLHLRPADLLSELRRRLPDPPDAEGLDAVLKQLCAWGNLEAHADTTDDARREVASRRAGRYFRLIERSETGSHEH